MDQIRVLFSAGIAYVLLLLYAGSVGYMIQKVATGHKDQFPSDLTNTVTTIGGLVSALVVAKLASTEQGQPPAVATPAVVAGDQPTTLNVALTAAYMVVWLLTGLAALVVGVMLFSGVNQALASIGSTWLGLAVAAAYAYFGLSPTQQPGQPRVAAPTAKPAGPTVPLGATEPPAGQG